MARPLYENSSTLEEEIKFFRDLTTSVTEYKQCRFRKLPLSYRLECAIEHIPTGKVTGFCEFKRRRNLRTHYPTLMLSLHKYRELAACSEFSDALLFVRWNDRDGLYEVNKHANPDIRWGGRTVVTGRTGNRLSTSLWMTSSYWIPRGKTLPR